MKVLIETEGFRMEAVDDLSGFKFRLVNKATGKFTRWAGYTQIATIDGMVAHTAYYSDKEHIVTCAEFVKMIGVTEDVDNINRKQD